MGARGGGPVTAANTSRGLLEDKLKELEPLLKQVPGDGF